MTMIIDQLNLLIWMQTRDGQKNINRPKPILEAMKSNSNVTGFSSVDDFERAKRMIIEKGGNE